MRRHAAEGVDIKYIHRTDRIRLQGRRARGRPCRWPAARSSPSSTPTSSRAPDFLRKTIDHFTDDKVAMVQTRWGHVNEDYSLLTKIQAILLDAHFVLEHGSRNRGGCFFNFNGTAGIWRRDAIVDGGGWQHDTLTEDLDLSYRTQLKGWRFVFLPDHVAPAELPVEMNAFKSQQHRWAKGSIQTFLKLMPHILRSDQPLKVKAEAFFHLSANFNYPLMCVLSVLMAPSMVIRYNMGWYEMLLIDVPLFLAATASVANFYMVCQRELYPRTWTERLRYLPFLMSIGIGLAVNNTKAVIEALLHKPSEFARTPKYRIEGGADEWMGKKYRQAVAIQPLIELTLGLYFTATLFYALANGIYGTVPFLMLFQVGLPLHRARCRSSSSTAAISSSSRSPARKPDGGVSRAVTAVTAPAPWLETERLALRRFTLDDLDVLARLNADPRVTEYLGGVKDRAATEALLRTRILDYYDQHPGLGIWATLERATGAVAGFHVLNHIQGETDRAGRLRALHRVLGPRLRHGDGASALLRHGYATLGLSADQRASPIWATRRRSTCC